MRLEQSDNSMLFSNTTISDVFFTEYFSQSSSDSIKVYLYLLFLSKYNKDVKLNDLSKKLALPLSTIQEALKYWEKLGIITKKNTGYLVNNLQEIELHRLYTTKISLSKEDVEKNEKNQYRAKAIENINNSFFQGIMSPSWYSDIDLWFKKYQFDEQVMIALFRYCFEHSALHRNYVQVVAESWSKNKIKTFTDLDLYFEKQEKLNKIKKDISKKLGLNRELTQYEMAYIEKWILDYNYDLDVIELALKRTTSKSNFSFDYLDKLISDWKERGFQTVNEVSAYLLQFKQKQKSVKELEKKSSYQNYEQRNYDNFDSFYANIQKVENE